MLIIFDIIAVGASGFLALFIRHELDYFALVKSGFLDNFESFAVFGIIISLAVFAAFRLYSSVLAFAGAGDLLKIIPACIIAVAAEWGYTRLAGIPMPRSYPIIKCLILIAFICVSRFSERIFRLLSSTSVKKQRRTMLIGAGLGGAAVIRETKMNPSSENKIVCAIDDNPAKHGRFVYGVRVVGGREEIARFAQKYKIDDIIVAMPSVSSVERRKIIRECQRTGCQLLTLPGIQQLDGCEVDIQKIRKVDVEDLLGQDSIKIDLEEIKSCISGKTVLVTGGGGSIGSELSRQLAALSPKELVVFDIYENNAYQIEQELRYKYPELRLSALIGSVRDEKRLNDVFEKYRPQLVFHAAAHKHVPLMESSPAEAVKNNIFGTYNTARAADRYGAEKMVLISTDKAVNPTNVMGASKRVCEMIIEAMDECSKTEFVAVRFGNVLGSNGSVIPLFKKQIEHGGHVTVTHKDIIRYFMTIPEAVSLVLQAGAYAKGGEIFILDMGEPVRIDDLARNMIRLSGLEPDLDILIEYTGLRPGEKLYEELLLKPEESDKTPNDLIFIGHPPRMLKDELDAHLEKLKNAEGMTPLELRRTLRGVVREFTFKEDELYV